MTRRELVLGWLQLAAVVAGGIAAYQYRAGWLAFAGRHPRSLVAGFLFAGGGGCLLAAGRFAAGRWRFVRGAERARGRVVKVAVRTVPAGEGGPDLDWHTPTVQFPAAGRTVEVTATAAATTDAKRWRPGDPVRVLYDPADPDRAMIDDWTKWRPMTLWLLFGVVLTAMAAFAAFAE